MALEAVTDFFTGQPKRPMVKISPTFPKRVIDTVCYAAQMYKVELRVWVNSQMRSVLHTKQGLEVVRRNLRNFV